MSTTSANAARPIRRAVLSVSDKSGLVAFARGLSAHGVRLLSTSSTFQLLSEADVAVAEVAAHTGFPEIMDGRVKTLHPKIHGGILGRRGTDDEVMFAHGIDPIDLVVVNLYPFEETVARPDVNRDLAIENIDIGGPAMVRSAAKNHDDVLVVVDPADYEEVLEALAHGKGTVPITLRARLAAKAFAHTAAYDAAIAAYLAGEADSFPESLTLRFRRRSTMRYGENPHQRAAFYVDDAGAPPGTVAAAVQHAGKALSFNNVADTDAALECVAVLEGPACVIVKHGNPCGAATGADLAEAYEHAYATDPTSVFGGIIAFNRPLEAALLETIVERQFAEVVIAPALGEGVLAVAARRKNLRLLTSAVRTAPRGLDLKRVGGGLLLQDSDELGLDDGALKTVTRRAPDEAEMRDLLFAWRIAWFVKSNAIVYARAGRTVGVGAGQMSRVVSARIAGLKAEEAGLAVAGAVMASDAFFPFRDGIDAAAEAGVRAVIQPGGSRRDDEVIAAADEHGLAMVFTGIRHFRH